MHHDGMRATRRGRGARTSDHGSFVARSLGTTFVVLPASRRRSILAGAVAVVSILGTTSGTVLAEDTAPSGKSAAGLTNAQLLEKLERMEARMRVLEDELHRRNEADAERGSKVRVASTKRAPASNANGNSTAAEPTPAVANVGLAQPSYGLPLPHPRYEATAPGFLGARETPVSAWTPDNRDLFGAAPSPVPGLTIGAYGEFIYGAQQNPDAHGQWQGGFDTTRFVLTPSFQLNDNIIFNAEIEFEHGGIAVDNDDKLAGTAEIEQAWVDFRITPLLNIRAPGIDLVPISWINLYHEPTNFYSARRPELDRGLIPTTWTAPSASVWGQIVEGLNYQFQLSTALEDFGSGFAARGANGYVVPFPIGYDPGITGLDALTLAKAPIGDFHQLSNYLGYTFRLSYAPTFLPGFDGGTSIYVTPSTTPRGAYSQLDGRLLGRSSLTIIETDFRYRVPDTGLELRGEFADVFIGSPANLRVNNDLDPTNNVGKSLWGASGEIAYHIPYGPLLGSTWDFVPFFRYTYQNFQTAGFAGGDLDLPTGAGQMQFYDVGLAVYPTPNLVMKLNYTKTTNSAPGAPPLSDSVLGAVGFNF